MTSAPQSPAGRPRILVFGGGGQLALSLDACQPRIAGQAEIVTLDIASADITNPASVARAFATVRPALVINAAAYTAVDRAESEEKLAFVVNAMGPCHMARECAAAGIPLIHVSTDYVFDGTGDQPLQPDHPVGPLNAYGRTKLAGEWAVLATHPSASFVFRTSWVFSPWGSNFVKTMLRLATQRDEIGVVADQFGCPTYAPDLADALLQVALDLLAGKSHRPGMYHFCNSGPTHWHAFAEAIFREAAAAGRTVPRVRAITTAEYPTPAPRPAWGVLDTTSTAREFGLTIPPWQDALGRCCMGGLLELE
jgi:dTDP-4-dehydrorhamnose reductase